MAKIVVDSGCDFTEDMKTRNQFTHTPLLLQVDDREFVDDADLDMDTYLTAMEGSPNTPKSAAPSPQRFYENYKGNDSVFVVTVSSKLSSSYNSAVLAAKMFEEELGKKFIHVFDSLTASVGETLVALKLNEYISQCLDNREIISRVNQFINNLKTYFIIDKYDTLVKSGRIGSYAAKIASMLSIKPIGGSDEGAIVIKGKARGYKKAVSKLIEMIKTDCTDSENRVLGISHAQCLEKALELRDAVLREIHFKDVLVMDMGALCTTYANRGGLVVSF